MAQLLTDAISRALQPRNIQAFLREPIIALELRNTPSGGGNCYIFQKISAPAYVVVSGDVLRYDVWCDPLNAGTNAGAIEVDLNSAPGGGRFVPLVDQDGVVLFANNPKSIGAWYSRNISLTAIAGNTINAVDLVCESDVAGLHRALYRNIRITDAAGTTTRVAIWSAGTPAYNVANYSNLQASVVCTAYDAPGWTGDPAQAVYKFGTVSALRQGMWHEPNLSVFPDTVDNTSPDSGAQSGGGFIAQIAKSDVAAPKEGITQAQWYAFPGLVIGKVMEFEAISQVLKNGVPVREVRDVRRATAKGASISGNVLTVQFADIDLSALQATCPAKKYEIADFPRLFDGHVGRTVTDGVGQLVRIPLTFIDNGATGTGPYIFGLMEKRAGYTYTLQTVYRSESEGAPGRIVGASEYTVGSGGPYTGGFYLNIVTFAREQKTISGQLYTLTADVLVYADNSGTTTDSRLVTNEIQYILGKAGITPDAATFAAAATAAVAFSGFCDAAYVQPRTLGAILNDLLMFARADLVRTATGAFALAQDVARSSVASFGQQDDEIEVIGVTVRDKPATVSLYYRPTISGTENWNISPRTRTPGGGLPEKRYYNPYVRDHLAADKLCDYLSKRDSIANIAQIAIHGAQMELREVFTVTARVEWIGDKSWNIDSVRRPADMNVLQATEYDASIYSYTSSTLPAGASNGYTADYSQTYPIAPTGVAIASEGVGTARVSWTARTEPNVVAYRREKRINGGAWNVISPDVVDCTFTDGPLAQGVTVDYRVYTVDDAGRLSAASAIVTLNPALQIQTADVAINAVTGPLLSAGAAVDNLILNGSFEDGVNITNNIPGWVYAQEGDGSFHYCEQSSNAPEGKQYLVMGVGGRSGVAGLAIPVNAGETYLVRARISPTNTPNQCYLRMAEATSQPAGGYVTVALRSSFTDLIAGIALPVTFPASVPLYEFTYTVPAGVKFVSPTIYNWASSPGTLASYLVCDAMEMRKQIRTANVQSGALRTSNYAEDGSGNPTAGAKLDHTGTAIKVKSGGLQVGTAFFTDYWARLVQAIDGDLASGRFVWRGNNDTSVRGGAPNIDTLNIYIGETVEIATAYVLLNFSWAIQPTAPSDNLDSMRYFEIEMYPNTGGASPLRLDYQAVNDRAYNNVSDSNSANAARGQFLINYRRGSSSGNYLFNSAAPYGFYGHLRCRMWNAYGPSAYKWFHGTSGSAGTTACSNTLGAALVADNTAPTGAPVGGGGGGGGGIGAGCPAPWVKIALINGKKIDAGDLHEGARLMAVSDSTMQPIKGGGIVRDLHTEWRMRVRLTLRNGKSTEFSLHHRIAVMSRGWVAIQDLKRGDILFATEESIVESVLAVGEGPVVVFRVDRAGTYFADDLLSHNFKPIP